MLICFIAGFAIFVTRGRYTTVRSLATVFVLSVIAVIVGTAFTAYGDIWVSGRSASDAASGFSILARANLLAPILLLILLAISSIVASRRSVT